MTKTAKTPYPLPTIIADIREYPPPQKKKNLVKQCCKFLGQGHRLDLCCTVSVLNKIIKFGFCFHFTT